MTTAFVTDGNERAALAITRSLGRRGIAVIVGHDEPGSLAGASRYCTRRIVYPSPVRHPSEFAEFLEGFLAREVAVVLPVTDATTRAVAARKEALGRCLAAVPPIEGFESVSDKAWLAARAASCGIPAPQTHVAHGLADLPSILAAVQYPVVVKPSKSGVLDRAWSSGTVAYARDASELRRLYDDTPVLRQGTSLVQEKILGDGTGLFVLCDRGRVVTSFAHRRLREKPPSGGVSVLCESVEVDPSLRTQAEQLLSPLGWHGVAMLEYKIDRRTGRAVLIEVNGRFWGSLQLAVDAGVDFPFLTWQLARGEALDLPASYVAGVMSRWFLGDFDHLLARVRHDRRDLPTDAPSTVGAAINFLSGARPGVRGQVLRRDDIRPAIFEAQQYVVAGVRGLRRAAGHQSTTTSATARVAQALHGGPHGRISE